MEPFRPGTSTATPPPPPPRDPTIAVAAPNDDNHKADMTTATPRRSTPPRPEPGQRPEAVYKQDRPTAMIELPSEGRFYAGNLPGGKVETLLLTGREDKILSAITGSNMQRIFDMVLARCVLTSISPADLLSTDRYYLMLALRAQALGPKLEWSFLCPCGQRTRQATDVPWAFPKVRGTAEAEPYHVQLSGGQDVAMRLLRGSDDRLIEQFRYPARPIDLEEEEEEPGDRAYGYEMARQIVSVNGKAFDDHILAADWVLNLPFADARLLRKASDDASPGVINTATAKCGSCGKETSNVAVPISALYFFR